MSDLHSEGKLEKILADGKFAVTGELGPPKHCGLDPVLTPS